MKTRKILSFVIALSLLMISAMVPSTVSAEVPTVTIDFSNPSDLEKYFDSVNGATGNWEIIDGVLTQTTLINTSSVYAPTNPGPGNPDFFQALTLKGQMLQDFTLEFDYIMPTPTEWADQIFDGYKYAKQVSLATNVLNGKEVASAANTGMVMTLYDVNVAKSMHVYKSPGNRALPSDVLYWTNKFHNFYPAYINGGPVRFKYVKTGNDLDFYVAGVKITPEWKILEANGIYETMMNEYARKGAVQLYTENGLGRFDNITITSADLDLSKFTTSVTIDFSDPGDLEKYFDTVNGATGNWGIVNGVLTQSTPINTTSVYAPTNPGPGNPDFFQALTLRGQMLQDFTLEFDYIMATPTEWADQVFDGYKYAKQVSLATNVLNGKEKASATNTGMVMTLYDVNVAKSMHVYKSPGNRTLLPDVLYWTNKFHNFYPAYINGGPVRFKYVKTGNDLDFYVAGVKITPEWMILEANGIYQTLMNEYARKGAVQLYTENGFGRFDNITITSADLDESKFAATPMIDFGTYKVLSNTVSKVLPGYTVANFMANNGFALEYGSTAVFTKNSLPISGTDVVGTGTVITFTNSASTATSTYELLVYGDTTGDGAIGLADLASAKSHLLNLSLLSGVQKQAGALTTPDKITISDLLKIKKTVLGLDTISQG